MASLIWICALAIFGWSLAAISLIADDASVSAAEADVAATQFVTYHQAVAAFLVRHPGHSGSIAPGALEPPRGYVADPAWTHQVVAGVGYTYTQPDYEAPPEFVDAISAVGGSVCIRRNTGNQADCGYGALGATARTMPPSVAAVVLAGRFFVTTH